MVDVSETLFVVDRPAGSEWLPGKGAREQPLWPEHAAFMDDLFERGLIALGGPFLDGSGAMVVLRVTRGSRGTGAARAGSLVQRRPRRPGNRQDPALDDLPRRPVMFFSVEERERVRDRVLALADADERVVAGAVVGSLALTDGDRFSDLDLTFAVADGISVEDVLADWTPRAHGTSSAPFISPTSPRGPRSTASSSSPAACSSISLSRPRTSFGARTPRFRLLFGTAAELPDVQPPPVEELFGHAVHHALRARFSLERGKLWLAEYWLSSLRDTALALACRRRGLSTSYGRGFDELPPPVLAGFEGALPRSLEPDELLRSLAAAVDGLLHEAGELGAAVEPQLRAVSSR